MKCFALFVLLVGSLGALSCAPATAEPPVRPTPVAARTLRTTPPPTQQEREDQDERFERLAAGADHVEAQMMLIRAEATRWAKRQRTTAR